MERGQRWLAAMGRVRDKHAELVRQASELRRSFVDYVRDKATATGRRPEDVHAHDTAAQLLEQRADDAERAVAGFEAALGAREKLTVEHLNQLLFQWQPGPGPQASSSERGEWLLMKASLLIRDLVRRDNDTSESVPSLAIRIAALVNEYAQAQPERVVPSLLPPTGREGADRVLEAARCAPVVDVMGAGSAVSRGKTIQKRGVPAACAVVLHQLGVDLNPETIHEKVRGALAE